MNGFMFVSNDRHIVQDFESNAERHPERIAVRHGDYSVSYAELNGQANYLAEYLQQRGVTESSLIGVFLKPSIESLVALIAILKMRAVYVPLDVEHPDSRLRVIVADVNPDAILTSSPLLERLDGIDNLIALDNLTFVDKTPAKTNLTHRNAASAPAYIFYTSGTTGKPKGVIGTQKNLTHYVTSAVECFGVGPQTVMPAIARFTFSISLFELLCPLVAGGCLVVLDREHILNLPKLAKSLEDVTMFHMGPSLFKNLVIYLQKNYPTYDAFKKIVHVSLGGDIVSPVLTQQLHEIFQHADIFVIYGCSEIACMGCRYGVRRDVKVNKSLVGRPFRNVELKLLDENAREVEAGEVGEIYFTGDGVTDGYLNLKELTAEKYLTISGKLFYRTGDLGRIDPDSNLEILGRSDFQVKIRGVRIELGEIEVNLQQIPGVSGALVTSVPGESGERSLCAYLVLDSTNPAEMSAIKAHLQKHLPDYMIPAYFVALECFPVNHNLKIDRAALPMPDQSNILTSDEFVSPNNRVEEELVGIWENILGFKNIGTKHNFFELGGDSILAAIFIVEVEKKFSKAISITAFFLAPTISEIAKLLLSESTDDADSDLFTIRKSGEKTLFLLHGAIIYRDLADSIDPDISVCVVYASEEAKLLGSNNNNEFIEIYSNIEEMAERYLKEIKKHSPKGPYYLAGFSMGGLVTLEVARLLVKDGGSVESVFLLDSYVPSFFKKFSWDKIVSNIRKTISKGVPHMKYMLHRVYVRLNEKKSLLSVVESNSVDRRGSSIEDIRYFARKNASDDYLPQPYDGQVVLFKASDRAEIGYVPKDRSLGWREFIKNLQIYDVPGEHLAILKNDGAKLIAGVMSSCINNLNCKQSKSNITAGGS